MRTTVTIESDTLNGEVVFENEALLLAFLKGLRADNFIRSEPEKVKLWWRESRIRATKKHNLKVTIKNYPNE